MITPQGYILAQLLSFQGSPLHREIYLVLLTLRRILLDKGAASIRIKYKYIECDHTLQVILNNGVAFCALRIDCANLYFKI